MKRLLGVSLLALALPAWGGQARVEGIRLSASPHRTRVVFDLSTNVQHNLFTLAQPARTVIDLENTTLGQGVKKRLAGDGLVEDVRSGIRHARDLRLVLDLEHQAKLHSFMLAPKGAHGYRLVVDLGRNGGGVSASTVKAVPNSSRPIVVAVDAGHGGVDDGARGPDGVMEKNVTLDIARKLAARVNATRGMKAFMTRKSDHYVGLKKRIVRAHKARADLFISIHANAVRDARYVHGAAVYVLSKHGASSTHAKLLARRENYSEKIGGTDLDNKDRTLASVLLDLSQTAAIEASVDLGGRLLDHLHDLGVLYKAKVQRANFVVLRSPDIPSVLVETAFITNPEQEHKLESSGYQGRVAAELMAGIRGYFRHYRPHRPGLRSAAERYRVHRGDTLSGIAARHQVSVSRLRAANAINSDTIQVGDTLKIPSSGG